ncbi:DUF4259 domain-containing protein [Deinococcus sp.]|uniref:DUF4259 domain-containing protein n=1 Tax=Deinococcus sp. TaxID=47478 RepID=UPI0025C61523|nr:DUF4259 domain-containing protein [Deinococcus sp.]
MKIWDTGPFDNDAAKDFVEEVMQDGDYALGEAFDVVLDADMDFIEAEEGCRVVAAAEILSAVLAGDTSRITDAGLRVWVQQADPQAVEPLRTSARNALQRVLGPGSELPDLWDEPGDATAWSAGVQQLRQRFPA